MFLGNRREEYRLWELGPCSMFFSYLVPCQMDCFFFGLGLRLAWSTGTHQPDRPPVSLYIQQESSFRRAPSSSFSFSFRKRRRILPSRSQFFLLGAAISSESSFLLFLVRWGVHENKHNASSNNWTLDHEEAKFTSRCRIQNSFFFFSKQTEISAPLDGADEASRGEM